MGIGKGKSDKIDIDGLIESSDNEGKILQVERSLTEFQDIKILYSILINDNLPMSDRSLGEVEVHRAA